MGIVATSVVVKFSLRGIRYAPTHAESNALMGAEPAGSRVVPAHPHQGAQFLAFQEKTDMLTLNYTAIEKVAADTVVGQDHTLVTVWYVSNDFFNALGVETMLGRVFLPNDDREGAENEVVITDYLWRQQFNASPNILGRTVLIDRKVCTVVGVLSPNKPLPPYFKGDIYRLFEPEYRPKPHANYWKIEDVYAAWARRLFAGGKSLTC